ncbi:MAG: hypothetical protein JRJ84_13210, partial [Deltaproteobacteria bacterium]|nr:hypothetical protein [Deltaproteobacteria bacterium]
RPGGADDALDASGVSATGISVDSATATSVVLIADAGTTSGGNFKIAVQQLRWVDSTIGGDLSDRSISFVVNDGTGDGPASSTTLSITDLDFAPELDLNGAGGGTTNGYIVSENHAAFDLVPAATVVDIDSNIASLTITLTNPLDGSDEALTWTDSGNVTGSYASHVLSLTGSDTPAVYQTVLRSVQYRNTSEDPDGTQRVIEYIANDGIADSNEPWTHVTTNAVNDDPIVELDPPAVDYTGTFTEDGGAVAVMAVDAIIDDVDDATLPVAWVYGILGPDESLTADTTATSIVATMEGDGDLKLTGPDTPANFQKVLRTVTYDSTDQSPPDQVTFTVHVRDTDNKITAADITLDVIQDPDAPTLDLDTQSPGTGSEVTFTEGDPSAHVAQYATIDDIDSTNLSSLTLTLTNPLDGADEEIWIAGPNITVSGDTHAITLSGAFHVSTYKGDLSSLYYKNDSEAPDETQRMIEVQATDSDGISSVTTTALVNVVGSVDPPVVDLNGAAGGINAPGIQYYEDDVDTALLTTDVTLSDIDHTQWQRITIYEQTVLGMSFTLDATPVGDVTLDSQDGGRTLVLQGPASLTDLESTLESLTFTLHEDDPWETFLSLVVEADDGDTTRDAIAQVTIYEVNDLPEVDLDGVGTADTFAVTWTEGDAPVVLAPAPTITDPDDTTLTKLIVVLTNPETGDWLESGSHWFDGTDLDISALATLADYETALGATTFEVTGDDPVAGVRTIEVYGRNGADIGPTVSGTVTVVAANDPPFVDLDDLDPETTDWAAAFQEGDAPVKVSRNQLEISDPDDTAIEEMTVVITNISEAGEEILDADVAATAVSLAGDGTSTLTLTGPTSIADFETVLATITYEHTGEAPTEGDRTVTVTVDDGDATASADSVITVTGDNDVPVMDLDTGNAGVDVTFTTTEGDGTVDLIGSAVSLSDLDDTHFEQIEISLAAASTATFALAATATGGITVTTQDAGRGLLLSGPATLADFDAVLESVTFTMDDEDPPDLLFDLDVIASDGDDVVLAQVHATLTAVNDLPEVDLDGVGTDDTFAVTWTEGGAAVALAPAVTIADLDDGSLAEVQVTLTNPESDDRLLTGETSSWSSGTLRIQGARSLADYASVLAGVTFESQTEDPVTGVRDVEVIVKDLSGGWSSPVAGTITVVPTNDAPLVDLDSDVGGTDHATTFEEGDPPVRLYYGVISDVDDTQFVGVTVVITDVQEMGDEVLAADTGATAISSDWDSSSSTLSLTGAADLADYQSVLDALTYVHAGEDPTEGDRHVTVTVDDGEDTATATATVAITAVNDAPLMDLDIGTEGVGVAFSYTENDGTVDLIGSAVSLSDVDDTHFAEVEISLTVASTLAFALDATATGGIIVTPQDSGRGLLLSGPATLADFDAVLESVTFTMDDDDPPDLLFDFDVIASDGDAVVLAQVHATLTAVNDLPEVDLDGAGTDDAFAVTWTEGDAAVTLAPAVTISDLDHDSLNEVKVTLTDV